MKFPAMRGLPIFWQTLILIFASVIVTQAVSIALFFALPPPRPDFNRMSDIAEALTGAVSERSVRERALIATAERTPPAASDDLIDVPRLTERLAQQLGVAPDAVRLYFAPDRWSSFPTGRRGGGGGGRGVSTRRGEPMFFNEVVAGLNVDGHWRVVHTPPPPLIGPWERRALLWFAVSALFLLPLAWFFATRMTRPIRRFADAADRLGADPSAPSVPEEGPSELRVTAHALNRMQQRVASYVAERTAMIGAIAHDLRTPLARIAFRIEAAPEPLRDKVIGDIEQMRAMIAATIGFVKGTSGGGAREPIELGSLLTAMGEAEREMGRDVTIGDVASVVVDGDRLGLERLFQNLIDNGVAYGGAVTVSVVREDAAAVVRVVDRGPGLPEDEIARMFQPFERGDKSRNRATGGVGLGLTIARGIADAHGATLDLRNRDGGGVEAVCRFRVSA